MSPSGVVSEMCKAANGLGVEWLTDLCNNINNIVSEGKLLEEWNNNSLNLDFKIKGDPLECGLYEAIKLLEQAMKVIERAVKQELKTANVHMACSSFYTGKGNNRCNICDQTD